MEGKLTWKVLWLHAENSLQKAGGKPHVTAVLQEKGVEQDGCCGNIEQGTDVCIF